jgi:hypothetical protein
MKTNNILPSSTTQNTLHNSWHGQLDLQFIQPQENTATQLIRSYACAPLKAKWCKSAIRVSIPIVKHLHPKNRTPPAHSLT